MKGKGTATTQVPEVAEMHSSCKPDHLCDSNWTAGRRECENWHWSDRTKYPLDRSRTRNHAKDSLLLSPKPSATEKPVLRPTSDEARSRTVVLSLHPEGYLINSQCASDCLYASQMDTGIFRAHYLQMFRRTTTFSSIPNPAPFEVNESSHEYQWDLDFKP